MVNVIQSEEDYNLFTRTFSNSFTANLTDLSMNVPISEAEKMEILMSENESKQRHKKSSSFSKDNYIDILEFVGLKRMKKVI